MTVKVDPRAAARSRKPFDSIENAQEYIRLLIEAVIEERASLERGFDVAEIGPLTSNQQEALDLAKYKLTQLESQLAASSRTLNGLRTIRRLLLNEREESVTAAGAGPRLAA